MPEEFDKETPKDIYIGRLVTELLKDGGTVTISKAGIANEVLQICYDKGYWKNRACIQKHEDSLNFRTLNEANYDSEDIIREFKREKNG